MRKLIYAVSASALILVATLLARTVQPATGTLPPEAAGIDPYALTLTIDMSKLPKTQVTELY